MKRIISFCMCLAMCMALFAQATDLTVDNQTPGWLSSKINYGDQQTVKNLKVTGFINSTDLQFIGTLMNKNLSGIIDLYDVNIVGEGKMQDNELIADRLFFDSNIEPNEDCHVQSLYLPHSVTSTKITIAFSIDTLVFDTKDTQIGRKTIKLYAGEEIKHLTIGENIATIGEFAFSNMNLKSVTLPSSLKDIANFAFTNATSSHTPEERDIKAYGVDRLVNLEHLGYETFERITPESFPDTLRFPSMKDFEIGAICYYKDGMHIFLGEDIEHLFYPSKTTYYNMWEPSIKNVYFHLASKQYISSIPPKRTGATFYVPKELLEEYQKKHSGITFIAEPVPLERIVLDKTDILLDVGEEINLIATPIPANADDLDMVWSVDDPNVLSVSQSGVIKALSSGSSTVTVTSSDGKIKGICKVVVKTHASIVKIEPSELSFSKIGETRLLQAVVLPEETYDKSVKWTSSNPSVCTVTASGMIVAMGYGDAVVMAITNDGNLPATCVVRVTPEKYRLTYMVDNVVYKSYDVDYTSAITPEAFPAKEGYAFSGWNGLPSTMPAKDVTVTGSFTVNKYKMTYVVDGVVYKASDMEYGAFITPESEPTKEGYSFSGWSMIPTTMPARDITITGSFTKGQYKLTYIVDGQTYKTVSMDYGVSITPEYAPEKEGYTFSGWSEIPTTMPAKNVTVTGSFKVNTYTLTYVVDGKMYKTFNVNYGDAITPEAEPSKEGYTFSGWSTIPATMPAKDVIVIGNFTLVDAIEDVIANDNTYQIYTIDGKPVNSLQKGVNIIRYPNGQTKKVFIK